MSPRASVFFFFSSRRRHTRLTCDWSSDVCSSDLQVYVDGVLSARDGRATLNLPTGRWRLELVRPGYRTETVDIEVNQGVSVRVDRRLERLQGDEAAPLLPEAQAATGELRLELKPDDAIVVLDGRAIGLASDLRQSAALRRLPAGRHQIEV